jgi:heme-degrading monooxygenase HmoA
MIARIWRGATLAENADKYLDYMQETGVKDLHATEGNRGVYVLKRIDNGRAEFVFISLWESMESIRTFAGSEVDKAVYYPRDREFLLELEPKVIHYEVMVKS